MIPKVIHYCWFGKNDLPEDVKKYINSWRKYLPDYKIIQWNENNFDINMIKYTKEAYENKKYAFVSDYVRLAVLYEYGGIYFDTDIEVIKNLDKFLDCNVLLGFEGEDNAISTGIMGSVKGSKWLETALEEYKNKSFVKPDGSLDCTVNVDIITKLIKNYYNIKLDNTYQNLNKEVCIYPREIFSPKCFSTGKINSTTNTHVIHHFNASWHTEDQKKFWNRKRYLMRFFSDNTSNKILGYYNLFRNVIKKLSIFRIKA